MSRLSFLAEEKVVVDNSQKEEPVRVVMSSQADDSDMIDDEDATVEVRMFLLHCIVNLMKFSRKLNVYERHLLILAQTFRKMPHPFFMCTHRPGTAHTYRCFQHIGSIRDFNFRRSPGISSIEK